MVFFSQTIYLTLFGTGFDLFLLYFWNGLFTPIGTIIVCFAIIIRGLYFFIMYSIFEVCLFVFKEFKNNFVLRAPYTGDPQIVQIYQITIYLSET